jgi:hypothetical protein
MWAGPARPDLEGRFDNEAPLRARLAPAPPRRRQVQQHRNLLPAAEAPLRSAAGAVKYSAGARGEQSGRRRRGSRAVCACGGRRGWRWASRSGGGGGGGGGRAWRRGRGGGGQQAAAGCACLQPCEVDRGDGPLGRFLLLLGAPPRCCLAAVAVAAFAAREPRGGEEVGSPLPAEPVVGREPGPDLRGQPLDQPLRGAMRACGPRRTTRWSHSPPRPASRISWACGSGDAVAR